MTDDEHTSIHRVCPWWLAYFFDNPLRRLFHNPGKMFAPYLAEGGVAVDIGCGMGFFSIGMAKIVGEQGRVHAVDLQEKILAVLHRRARRRGVDTIIVPEKCGDTVIDLSVAADFVLAFWVVHEVPDANALAQEVFSMLKPGGYFFMAEPRSHVSDTEIDRLTGCFDKAGLKPVARPRVALSTAFVYRKETSG
jgi:2-polyprenyl-3-methyl-5-hydroxy-6-metoxy-1,4-benzoquinol methylase